MLINFISNLPRDLRSGGFSAMNAAAFAALAGVHDAHYIGPVNPPPALASKGLSKLLRFAGLPGNYFFFAQSRLEAIAAQFRLRCSPQASLDFFHGFTPWIATRPQRRYAAWSDCSFRDYISLYHDRAHFRAADLQRIEQLEAAWLRGASAVGFTSGWAAERTTRDYGLDPARVSVLGIFGESELPDQDCYAGARQFAFVSTDFAAKGGHDMLSAFREVRARFADASLIIVGDVPHAMAAEAGVTVLGYLRKEVPAENQRLRDILASSRAVVLPTRSDIAPLLLVEAGYFGCPVIATRSFAIGEIVEGGATGLLLDDARDVAGIAAAMMLMLEADDESYQAMRRAAWNHTRAKLTKAQFDQRLLAMIESTRTAQR